jgi:2-keto-4-pentenoate hydratase
MSKNTQAAADLLVSARREHRRITLPANLRPADFTEAYAIQSAVERELGATPVAWKVGAPDAKSTPSAAPIYEVISSPARIEAGKLHMIGVEAEVAAVFTGDLPARDAPYSEAEVMTAVQELRVVIEVCDSRLSDWQTADDATKLCDHQLNFALVVGDAVKNPNALDYSQLAVRTLVDGKVLKEGIGTHAVGNPLRLLPWLANHARTRGGIRAGTIATLGAWLGLHVVQPGSEVTVEFPALGKASVSFER